VDRVSIRTLISPPILCRSSSHRCRHHHPRVTAGPRRGYPIRLQCHLRTITPRVRGRSSRRAFWVSRKTRWISSPGRKRGRTCRRLCRVRVYFLALRFVSGDGQGFCFAEVFLREASGIIRSVPYPAVSSFSLFDPFETPVRVVC
jgi:hypothetical protein